MDSKQYNELTQLCSKLLDDSISEKEFQRLDEILKSSAEARQVYMHYVDLHDVMPEIAVPMPVTTEPAMKTVLPQKKNHKILQFLPAAIAIAALVTLGFTFFQQFTNPVQSINDNNNYVATLRGSVNSHWQKAPLNLQDGARIPLGHYDLSQGQAELIFDSGASLLIDGPCEFEITGPKSAMLLKGNVVFNDGGGAQPFNLRTKRASLVDIGTHYALSVKGDHEDLHVFDGAVEIEKQNKKSLIEKGGAIRYSDKNATESIKLASERFTHKLNYTGPTGELLAIEPFNNAMGSGQGWASSWEPLPKKSDALDPLFIENGKLKVLESKYIGVLRHLEQGIDLSKDGVYYISLVIKSARPNFFLILRSQRTQPKELEPGVRFGIRDNSTMVSHFHGTEIRTAVPLAPSESYRVVCKIVASAEHNDQTFLHLSPASVKASSFEPKTWTTVTSETHSDGLLNRLNLLVRGRQSTCEIDDLRIGTSWTAVTSPVAN